MAYDIYTISSYSPRPCGIATFTRSFLGGLGSYTGEIASKYVLAIDDSGELGISYDPLIEGVVNQFDESSWKRHAGRLISRSAERQPRKPVVVLQHEFGLDGKDAQGNNYVSFAKIINAADIPVYTYLHTVKDDPSKHELKTTKELSKYSDRLIVTTNSAIGILKDVYGIDPSKVKHIDHGIRMIDHSKYNREKMKEKYGIEKKVVSTLGLKSKNKGLGFGIEGFGKFLSNSSNKDISYLIAGQWHEGFVAQEKGKFYREEVSNLEKILKKFNLSYITLESLEDSKNLGRAINENNVVFLDKYLSEDAFLDFYGLTDLKLIPYRNPQQISSGILADTIGSGRTAVATKFLYSLELLSENPEKAKEPGLFLDTERGRGILVDLVKGKDEHLFDPNTDQLAQGTDYLLTHDKEKKDMEQRDFERGHKMRWDIVAGEFIRDVQFLENLKK